MESGIWNQGFPPVINHDSKVLILGSFPSVISRRTGFYYGNPRNRFWQVLGEFFSEKIPYGVEERKAFILTHGLALWDVVDKSSIKGSSDGDIRDGTAMYADIKELIEGSSVGFIILNGKKAYGIFKRIYPECVAEAVCLPSTSPANTSFDKRKWFETLEIATGKHSSE